MTSLKAILFISLGLYILGLFLLMMDARKLFEHSHLTSFQIREEHQQGPYKFSNPRLAYQVLTQLENQESKASANSNNAGRYCDKRRASLALSSESLFHEINFLSDSSPKSLIETQVLMQLGNEVQPYINPEIHVVDQASNEIKSTVTTFYTKLAMFRKKELGHDFSCLSQASNHIPGKQAINSEAILAESIIDYARRFSDKPHCFRLGKVFPETYLLYEQHDCQEFFKVLDSPKYRAIKEERTFVYIKKLVIGGSIGAGGEPVHSSAEKELRNMYDNGRYCGKVHNKYVIQKYIQDPLLFENYKIDFRMFMLVASVNPLIVYYQDGFLQVNSIPPQQWDLNKFLSFLLDNKIIKDPNWLNTYLRPEFKKAMIDLLRAGAIIPFESSSVYQLYAVDFTLDTNLNVWFVKAIPASDLSSFAKPVENIIVKVLSDEIEIVVGLLRSRMKRVIDYVNELLREGEAQETRDGDIEIRDIELRRLMFQKITENRFEKEFRPKKDNGFYKIYDGNYNGGRKYGGLISYECL